MKKNILVITGSPRKGGNSDLMAEAFMKGARTAGHEVAKFDSAADPVMPCRACDACWSGGKACAFSDGFDRLSPLLENADVIALCGPLYFATFGAQLKSAIDKLHAYSMPQALRRLKGKMFLLMCAANPSLDIFSPVAEQFRISAGFLGLTIGGELLVPGMYEKGAIEKTDALALAEQLGRESV